MWYLSLIAFGGAAKAPQSYYTILGDLIFFILASTQQLKHLFPSEANT